MTPNYRWIDDVENTYDPKEIRAEYNQIPRWPEHFEPVSEADAIAAGSYNLLLNHGNLCNIVFARACNCKGEEAS